jgi:hypothetical protein
MNARLATTLGLIIGILSVAAWSQPAPPVAATTVPLDPAVQSIRQAADPSAAIEAYARIGPAQRDNPAVPGAFVQRMVDFGLPEMADVQAQELIRRQPNDGLAWAVSAYMSAKRGQPQAALAQILSAARHAPAEPFVQRTAGQLLAWYDVEADPAHVPQATRDALPELRKQLETRQHFTDAYKQATEAYQQARATTQPAPAPPPAEPSARVAPPAEPPAPPPPPTTPAPRYESSTYESSTYYPPPTYVYNNYIYRDYSPAYVYQPWWPSSYYYSSWIWWPSLYSSVVLVRPWHHHHLDRDVIIIDRDRDRDRDHRWDVRDNRYERRHDLADRSRDTLQRRDDALRRRDSALPSGTAPQPVLVRPSRPSSGLRSAEPSTIERPTINRPAPPTVNVRPPIRSDRSDLQEQPRRTPEPPHPQQPAPRPPAVREPAPRQQEAPKVERSEPPKVERPTPRPQRQEPRIEREQPRIERELPRIERSEPRSIEREQPRIIERPAPRMERSEPRMLERPEVGPERADPPRGERSEPRRAEPPAGRQSPRGR